MDVDLRIPMGIGNLIVIDLRQPVIGGNCPGIGQDQTSHRIGNGGILLHPPVIDMEVVVHHFFIIQQSRLHIPKLLPLAAVKDIGLCHIGIAGLA